MIRSRNSSNMTNPLDRCKDAFYGQSVLLIGNGPSARNLSSLVGSYDKVVTVNAGLSILKKEEVAADLLWIQDSRMLIDKPDMVIPYLKPDIWLCVPRHGRLPTNLKSNFVMRVSHLGNSGFSRDPRIGVFTGYNALYGLTQLMAWCEPKKLGFVGIDMDYSLKNPRAYQSKRGFDVDLHVNDLQISHALKSFRFLGDLGVGVEIHAISPLLSRSLG